MYAMVLSSLFLYQDVRILPGILLQELNLFTYYLLTLEKKYPAVGLDLICYSIVVAATLARFNRITNVARGSATSMQIGEILTATANYKSDYDGNYFRRGL